MMTYSYLPELGTRPRAQRRQARQAATQARKPAQGQRRGTASPTTPPTRPSQAARREARKAGQAQARERRQLSARARQEARRIARELKKRKRVFNRLFRSQGMRGLGFNPAAMANMATAGQRLAQAQSSPSPAQQAAPGVAEVGLFEQNLTQVLNEAEINAVGKFVSAWIGQGQDRAQPAQQDAFVRSQLAGDPVLGTAWAKLRSAYVSSSQGAASPAAPSQERSEGATGEDQAAGDRSASVRSPQTGGNNNLILIGLAAAAGLAYVATRPSNTKKTKRK